MYTYIPSVFRCLFHLGHHRTFLQILNQGFLFLIIYKSICSFLLDTYLLKVWNEAFYKIQTNKGDIFFSLQKLIQKIFIIWRFEKKITYESISAWLIFLTCRLLDNVFNFLDAAWIFFLLKSMGIIDFVKNFYISSQFQLKFLHCPSPNISDSLWDFIVYHFLLFSSFVSPKEPNFAGVYSFYCTFTFNSLFSFYHEK